MIKVYSSTSLVINRTACQEITRNTHQKTQKGLKKLMHTHETNYHLAMRHKECSRRQHSRPPASFTGTIPQQLGLSLSLIYGDLILEIQIFDREVLQ